MALLDEIGQPAGTRDDDIGTVTQPGHLRILRDPAVGRRDAQPTAWASGARTTWTWLARSRVGKSTRPRGRQALVQPSARLAASGIEKLSVLPDPVCPA